MYSNHFFIVWGNRDPERINQPICLPGATDIGLDFLGIGIGTILKLKGSLRIEMLYLSAWSFSNDILFKISTYKINEQSMYMLDGGGRVAFEILESNLFAISSIPF